MRLCAAAAPQSIAIAHGTAAPDTAMAIGSRRRGVCSSRAPWPPPRCCLREEPSLRGAAHLISAYRCLCSERATATLTPANAPRRNGSAHTFAGLCSRARGNATSSPLFSFECGVIWPAALNGLGRTFRSLYQFSTSRGEALSGLLLLAAFPRRHFCTEMPVQSRFRILN